jgi:hypothetical protein
MSRAAHALARMRVRPGGHAFTFIVPGQNHLIAQLAVGRQHAGCEADPVRLGRATGAAACASAATLR